MGRARFATMLAVWHTTGVKTIEDAKQKEVIMGATGAGGNFAGHVALLNSVLGTKFKIVTGYDGGNSINLAIERGEVQGKANTTWAAFKSITPQWVSEHKIVPLVQFGLTKDPELPNVPLLIELATNDDERRMLDPAFRSDAAKLGQLVEMKATTGDEVAAIVKRTVETPDALAKRLQVALEVKARRAGNKSPPHRA